MATVVSAMFLAGCADDVYDPSKERPTPPAENPFGEGFAAPDGFGWSMMNTVNLNVEVKDEESGQYQYLVEVFATNPLVDGSAQPIAAGLAKGGSNYLAEVTLPKTVESLYIRQTDPRQRKEIYQYAVPENGGALSAKLYYNNSTTRGNGTTGSTTAADAAPASMDAPNDPNYQENKIFVNIPEASSGAVEQNWGVTFEPNGKFVITSDYTDQNPFSTALQGVSKGRASVYVKGTWKLSTGLAWGSHNFDIYVLNGGKIIVDGTPTIGHATRIYIATGGTLESKVNQLELGSSEIINFGSIITNSFTNNIGDAHAIYNAGKIETNGDIRIIKTTLINKGNLAIEGMWDMNSNNSILNTGKISTHNMTLVSTYINNYGELIFNEEDGIATTNNNTNTGIVNHYEGSIKGYHWLGGLSLYNDGFIEVTYFENGSVDALYNSCTLIVKERFLFQNLTLDNGSVTGGKPDNFSSTENNAHLWKPVPLIGNNTVSNKSGSPINMILKNGSMIKAEKFNITSAPNTYKGEGNAPSLMQFKEVHIDNGGNNTLSGNLVVEIGTFTYGSGIDGVNNGKWLAAGIPTTGWDESKYSFSTCGGYYTPGNPGEPNPTDPEFPIITEDATNYTFAFEDNWPTYGDFDLNDIVTTLDKITVALNGNGSVGSYKIEGTLQAVGASKKLGLGIQFLGFSANNVSGVNGIVQGMTNSASLNFEAGQTNPVLIICNDAHSFLGNAADDREYINTIADGNNNKDGAKFEISVTFRDGAVAPADININKLDMFVISREADAKTKRIEIHAAGYAPTDLGNTNQFGNGNDNSSVASKRYYLSKENLAWGVVVPTNFAWPLEYRNIKDVYGNFESWVTSGGKENKDWYNHHNGQVFKK